MTFQRPSLDHLKARFEADINRNARIYNLTPAIPEEQEKGKMYWALHTERAWDIFQMGVNAAFDAIEAQSQTCAQCAAPQPGIPHCPEHGDEYEAARKRLEDAQEAFNAEEARLKALGYADDEVDDGLESFASELAAAEVAFNDLAP